MRSKQEIANLTPRSALAQAHDEFEPPCHLCGNQVVSGESYVQIKFNSDRTRYAVCLPWDQVLVRMNSPPQPLPPYRAR